MKKFAKILLWRPLLAAMRASSLRAGAVLVYHDVANRDGDGQRELVPPTSRARLAGQLSHLRRHYQLVELPDLTAAVAARHRSDRFPVALTFDDDLSHHVTQALPELRSAQAPATFFLCGSFLAGPPGDFWWQRLQRAVDAGTDVARLAGTGTIRQQGQVIEALAPDRRDAVADELQRLAPPAPAGEFLTVEQARQLPHIGFHTARHDRLTRLDDRELERALTVGRAELAALAGYPVDTIAYPHGHHDARVVAAARARGFTIGVTLEHEAVTPDSDPLALGRYAPPCQGSPAEFAFGLVRTLLKSPRS